jgi:FtsP/CotA-like multicopper oxidase with cupredoxin domain
MIRYLKIFCTALLVLGSTGLVTVAAAVVPPVACDPTAPPPNPSDPPNPQDGCKIPHYFGPWPNWANSPLTIPTASVTITDATGTGATATAQVDPKTGIITGITVDTPGQGYSPNPTVKINGATTGTPAQAQATVSTTTGAVTATKVVNGGLGYKGFAVALSGNGGALLIASGGVDKIAVPNGGSGYTNAAVVFGLPDRPNGTIAQASATLNASGAVTGITVTNPGSGYTSPPVVHIFNGAAYQPLPTQKGFIPAVATATLKLTGLEVAVDNNGTPLVGSYTQAPTVTITDPTAAPKGTGATATVTIGKGWIKAITQTTQGTGYLSKGIKKFQDPLPGVCNPTANGAGCPTAAQTATPTMANKFIPLAVPVTRTYKDPATGNDENESADVYVIGLVQYLTKFNTDLPPTLVRGYVQLSTKAVPGQKVPLYNELRNGTRQLLPYTGVTAPQWLGPIIVAQKDRPVRIVFRNLLPTGAKGDFFLPTDGSMMGAGMGPMSMAAPSDNGTVLDEARKPACSYPSTDPNKSKGDGECFTDNRATLHLHGGTTPWISDGTPHQWITPANDGTPWPQGVSVRNVPDMQPIGPSVITGGDPVEDCAESPPSGSGKGNGCQTFYYTNQQSARLMFYHDHAWGITRLNVYAGEAAGYIIQDPAEATLVNNGIIPNSADTLTLVVQDRTFVPNATQIKQEDPTWDATRWGGEGSLWYHHVYMPLQNHGDPTGQSAYGRWLYGPWFWPAANPKYGLISNPYYKLTCNRNDPNNRDYDVPPYCEPEFIPGTPNISVGMEQFNDTPIVNGVAYPTLTLEAKPYRLRILNAANDRAFNFQWYTADPKQGNGTTEVALDPVQVDAALNDLTVFPIPVGATPPPPSPPPSPGTPPPPLRAQEIPPPPSIYGPYWIQIASEGGFLPTPAYIDGQQPTTFITDPGRFDFGNVDKHSLMIMPAERADVIVDFTNFVGKTLILYNDAPAAYPARMAQYDYYAGSADLTLAGGIPPILPGYGPNIRTVMQVKIVPPRNPAQANKPFNIAALNAAFRHNANLTGVFESSQHPIIVGQSAYNLAYGASFSDNINCNGLSLDVPQATWKPQTHPSLCDGIVRVADLGTAVNPFEFNTLLSPTAKVTVAMQPKAIHDEANSATFDEYGRQSANLGMEASPPTPAAQNVTLFPYVNPPTELIDATHLPSAVGNVIPVEATDANADAPEGKSGMPLPAGSPKGILLDRYPDGTGTTFPDPTGTKIKTLQDGTQIWRFTHNGVDTHPIHFHLFDVQLINRVTWDDIIIPAEDNELGWKDTVRMSPLQDTIVALRPVIPKTPFEIPNSVRVLSPLMLDQASDDPAFPSFQPLDPNGNGITLNKNLVINFGWEYVYHCHILSHEEMDMMRPVSVAVPPRPVVNLKAVLVGGNVQLSWDDDSINATSFSVERSDDGGITWNPVGTGTIDFSGLGFTLDEIAQGAKRIRGQHFTFPTDPTPPTPSSRYRVFAVNTVGYDYGQTYLQDGTGYPMMSAKSLPTEASISLVATEVSVSPSNTSVVYGQPVTFTVTVTVPTVPAAKPSGTVSLVNSSGLQIATGPLDTTGTNSSVKITVPSAALPASTTAYSLTMKYLGSSVYASSSTSVTMTVTNPGR